MINLTMLAYNRPKLTEQAKRTMGNAKWLTLLDTSQRHEGTAQSRNHVIELSEKQHGRGELLYLSDNDVFFKACWLDVLTACYAAAWEKGFKVLGGYNHPFHRPIASIPAHGHWRVHEVQALALQSMLMRWEIWDRYGPFKETMPGAVCQGEDVEFGNAIKADGGRLGVVAPALIINCGLTNSFGKPIPGIELVREQLPEEVYAE